MARALSLSAYLAFTRREQLVPLPYETPKPSGAVIWLHCSDKSQIRAMVQLGLRLTQAQSGLSIVLTIPPNAAMPEDIPEQIYWQPVPSENPTDVRAFLEHWQPEIALWSGQWLRPGLIDEAVRRGIPMFLLEAENLSLENKRWRWLPEPTRATLRLFSGILTGSPDATRRLGRMIGVSDKLIPSGQLLEDPPALTYSSTDLDDISSALEGRPVWLAAMIQPEELEIVLAAHCVVLRKSHRTLLVVVPDTPTVAAAFYQQCKAAGMRIKCWDDGDFPDKNTQVLIAENKSELGLWYRVAPISLMGSSLVSGFGGRNPYEPAALGSGILYGTNIRQHLDAYSRLARAGAARIVKDTDSLTAALGILTAPDQIAAMAHAGWETASEGAVVTDQITELVQTVLDEKGVG